MKEIIKELEEIGSALLTTNSLRGRQILDISKRLPLSSPTGVQTLTSCICTDDAYAAREGWDKNCPVHGAPTPQASSEIREAHGIASASNLGIPVGPLTCIKCGGRTWQLGNGLCAKCDPNVNAA